MITSFMEYTMDTYSTAGEATTTSGAAIEETDRLIASDKVEGTAVYNRQDEHLGTVHNFMVDKSTGRVAYAVMSFGGFLGMGQSYHPLPWRVLNYDTRRGGFVVDLDRSRLEKAPTYTVADMPNWSDRTYGNRIDEFYGVPSYWGMI
jgi:PRC-barrel domain